MGMTIDEIIKKENEIAAEFQKVVDTHIVNDNEDTIEEIYCDDTEAIEEHLQRCKVFADYHNQIADTMCKYQKIEKIINAPIGGTSAKYNAIVNLIKYSEVNNGNID